MNWDLLSHDQIIPKRPHVILLLLSHFTVSLSSDSILHCMALIAAEALNSPYHTSSHSTPPHLAPPHFTSPHPTPSYPLPLVTSPPYPSPLHSTTLQRTLDRSGHDKVITSMSFRKWTCSVAKLIMAITNSSETYCRRKITKDKNTI